MFLLRRILSLVLDFLILLSEHFIVELSVKALVLCDLGSIVLIRLTTVRACGRHGRLSILACLLELLLVPVRGLTLIRGRLLLGAVLSVRVLMRHSGLWSGMHDHTKGRTFRLVDRQLVRLGPVPRVVLLVCEH